MSSNSILAGLGMGECIDSSGEVQLLAEMSCQGEELCLDLQEALILLPCQVEWQEKGGDLVVYVVGDKGADQDQLLSAIALFIDERPNQIRLIETRLAQSSPATMARHGFRFVSSDPFGPKDIVLATDSHAFGSGSHPSTSLVVELLEELPEIPTPVLDVGCGTGVLSLVAGRLGALQVVGVDIDQEAVLVAAENARVNNLDHHLSFTTSSLQELEGLFTLIVANLTGSVLYRLLAAITGKAGPGCRLIISGLQGRQGDEAEAWAVDQGWHLEQRRALGKWQARVLVKEVG